MKYLIICLYMAALNQTIICSHTSDWVTRAKYLGIFPATSCTFNPASSEEVSSSSSVGIDLTEQKANAQRVAGSIATVGKELMLPRGALEKASTAVVVCLREFDLHGGTLISYENGERRVSYSTGHVEFLSGPSSESNPAPAAEAQDSSSLGAQQTGEERDRVRREIAGTMAELDRAITFPGGSTVKPSTVVVCFKNYPPYGNGRLYEYRDGTKKVVYPNGYEDPLGHFYFRRGGQS